MIKVGLWGYGKMGRAIEALAESQGIQIVWVLDRIAAAQLTDNQLKEADVVIEITRPEAARQHIERCIRAGVPVVSGTTGWQSELPEVEIFCRKEQGAMLWASNFSIGVNLFFLLNEHLATLLHSYPAYQPSIVEQHHIHKLDAPSGTAVTLAEGIITHQPDRKSYHLCTDKTMVNNTVDQGEIPITAIRQGEIPGTHTITWESDIDTITIEHAAHNRTGFALGAIVAAKWIVGKKGCFSMRDIFTQNKSDY
jgi:4-hydroxy-tetrahydrodipicolinate reductase